MRTYRHPAETRDFFAPDVEPSVDANVPVLHVSGLDNYVIPRPLLHKMPASQAKPALGSGPLGSYMGNDFRNAYVPGASQTGSGQSVGLLQFDSGFFQSDITAYETQAGLPNVPVQPVLLDGYAGSLGNSPDEVSLDIEMVISMAPGVSKIYVFEGSSTDDILNAMAASNQVKQLSASWIYNIDATSEQIFQQFAAQGQSFFNASGDFDSWVGFGFIYPPCDDPHITIVGGTTLSTTGTNGPWASETVWNWGVEYGIDGIGSGGGISSTYAIPAWQTNINMTANHGSTIMRNIPDVALTADNVYVIYGGGSTGAYGGTSCASPLWAGFMALVNQQAVANGKPTLGFINPAIYAIGATNSIYTNCFHDIITGNNTWSASPAKFFAVPGYDLCTGLGTPIGNNLIAALAGAAALQVSAPPAPYGSTLSALNGGNPNGIWELFVQDDALLDSGTNYNGWILNLTLASPVGYAADNQLLMTCQSTNITLGTNAVFYLSVTNYGPSPSTNAFVSDNLPDNVTFVSVVPTQGNANNSATVVTWDIGTLAVSNGAQLILTVKPNSIGPCYNSAIVNSVTPDPNPDDDSADCTVFVNSGAPPQLSPTVAAGNGQFKFSITSANSQINIIEATTNLAAGPWVPIYTNTGSFTFTNLYLTNYPDVFFRDRVGP
jgi:uncharacterized repeat protein (TIGR01451 family)